MPAVAGVHPHLGLISELHRHTDGCQQAIAIRHFAAGNLRSDTIECPSLDQRLGIDRRAGVELAGVDRLVGERDRHLGERQHLDVDVRDGEPGGLQHGRRGGTQLIGDIHERTIGSFGGVLRIVCRGKFSQRSEDILPAHLRPHALQISASISLFAALTEFWPMSIVITVANVLLLRASPWLGAFTLTWSVAEKLRHGKSSVLGAVTGALAGLALLITIPIST